MTIKDALQIFSKRAWRQHCISEGLIYLPMLLIVGVLSYVLFDLTTQNGLFIAFGVVLGLLPVAIFRIYFSAKSTHYKARFSLFNCAEHFNQQYPQLEFSCHLALKNNDELSVLQQMQLTRIKAIFADLMGHEPKLLKPRLIAWRKIFVAWLLWILANMLLPYVFNYFTDNCHDEAALQTPTGSFVHHSKVMITPPDYTQLPTVHTKIANLTVIEGSTVTWQITTDNSNTRALAPQLKLGDKRLPLQQLDDDRWTVSHVINQTGLYQLGLYQLTGQQLEGHYTDLHTITVTKDQAPTIRMLAPTTTLVTFANDQQPQLTTKALVSDDFAISEIKLVASLAKGSGEAVKFRDLNVAFDVVVDVVGEDGEKSEAGSKKNVQKTWDFKALGMEPGDELYFSVHATDNKMPTPQTSRSSTVIVRWLDEDQQLISADGLLLTYMPEYFRSQRQIIIETEQLIADMPQLSQTQIDDTSISLAQSQQDLKLRYGQYLGDEVGQGPGEQADFIGGAYEHANEMHEDEGHGAGHSHRQRHSHRESHSENHSDNEVSEKLQQAAAMQEKSHGHDHNDQQDSTLGSNQAVTSAFAHAHEEVHVGEVSTQNPKAMMKKAVSFMWQAELHLQLSEPQKALPFELQAYKYLKLAKQSERIYVKRLGFEPPPVSEDKRLTGELDDIKSYQVEKQLELSDNDNQLFSKAFHLFSFDKGGDKRINRPRELNLPQQQMLKRLKTRLTELAQTRPALINFALTIEKILITNSVELTDCDDCIRLLRAKLWQLIEVPVSEPVKRQAEYLDGDNIATDFMKVLESRSAP